MKNPILLYDLIEKLDKYKYTIVKQVLNFKNKVIGVVAKSPTFKTGFIPCYPSAIIDNLKENLSVESLQKIINDIRGTISIDDFYNDFDINVNNNV